jgi:hypothetical protein
MEGKGGGEEEEGDRRAPESEPVAPDLHILEFSFSQTIKQVHVTFDHAGMVT